MLNLVRQIKLSLNRNPSLELLDITHAQYTYTYLLTVTGRISKLGLHSLKSYTCVRITSWITLACDHFCVFFVTFPFVVWDVVNRNCLGQFRGIPWNQNKDVHRGSTFITRVIT